MTEAEFPWGSTFLCACLRFRRINILRTHYHDFSMFIGATHTPSSRLYAPPTAVRTNKNDGAFSSLFWAILSRSLLRLSAPSLIRSSPLTHGKIWNSQDFQYSTLVFKEIIYLRKRVDNLWARVARLANIKDKQSMDLWFRTLFFFYMMDALKKRSNEKSRLIASGVSCQFLDSLIIRHIANVSPSKSRKLIFIRF